MGISLERPKFSARILVRLLPVSAKLSSVSVLDDTGCVYENCILKKLYFLDRYLLNWIDCCGARTLLESPAASPSQRLYDEVKRLDAVLSEAFNNHDVNKLKSLVSG